MHRLLLSSLVGRRYKFLCFRTSGQILSPQKVTHPWPVPSVPLPACFHTSYYSLGFLCPLLCLVEFLSYPSALSSRYSDMQLSRWRRLVYSPLFLFSLAQKNNSCACISRLFGGGSALSKFSGANGCRLLCSPMTGGASRLEVIVESGFNGFRVVLSGWFDIIDMLFGHLLTVCRQFQPYAGFFSYLPLHVHDSLRGLFTLLGFFGPFRWGFEDELERAFACMVV